MSSGNGCPIDAVDGLFEDGVEFGVALADAQLLCEGAGEAGDEAVVAREFFVRIVLRVAAAEGDDTYDVRVFHDTFVEVVDGRDGDLEHDLGIGGQLCEVLFDGAEHDLLCLFFIGAVDVDLRLEDGDKPLRDAVLTERKLLVDDGTDAVRVCLLDDRAHLRAENVACVRAVKECAEVRDGLHELDAVRLGRKPLVDLQDGDDALFLPEIVGGVEPVDLAVHCVLKEDGGKNFALVECGALDDARSHLVNARKHLLVTVLGALVDAGCFQCLRRRAAALIECGDKAFVLGHAFELFLIHWTYLLLYENMRGEAPFDSCFYHNATER